MTDFDADIGTPTVLVSNVIAFEPPASSLNITAVTVTINYTGNISFDITANSTDASPTWDNIPLTSKVSASKTLTLPGKSVAYRIIGAPGTTIQNTKNTAGNITIPAITINLTYA